MRLVTFEHRGRGTCERCFILNSSRPVRVSSNVTLNAWEACCAGFFRCSGSPPPAREVKGAAADSKVSRKSGLDVRVSRGTFGTADRCAGAPEEPYRDRNKKSTITLDL